MICRFFRMFVPSQKYNTTENKKLLMKKILLAFLLTVSVKAIGVNPPTMGWSSWNTYRVHINEKLICSQADAMLSSGLKEVGYKFINIDDGYFGGRDEQGNLKTHPERFPNGLKGTVDYIHSLGFKAGIYSEAGIHTCGYQYDNDKLGAVTGMYGNEQRDADYFFKQLGFDFIKIDFCGGLTAHMSEKERYMVIRKAIDAAGGPDIRVNVCRWDFPGTWVKEAGQSWRISPDINPSWGSVKYIIEKNLCLSAYAGDGHFNDMDMLEIGRGLSEEEEYTHFGMWCIMSSPLLIGCDMTTIPQRSLELLKNKELIAINQDVLGLQAYPVQCENQCYVLVKDLEQREGKVRAVALYNPTDETQTITVPLEKLGFEKTVKVRNATHKTDEENATNALTRTIPAHGTVIYRLTGNRTEQTVYEGEQAYLHAFVAWDKTKAHYQYDTKASCNHKIVFLGNDENNYAEWNKIYSQKGGRYELTIYYDTDEQRDLVLTVNGEKLVLSALCSGLKNASSSVTVTVDLKKGYNTVRMGNSKGWAPNIDRFELKRIEK